MDHNVGSSHKDNKFNDIMTSFYINNQKKL